MRWRYATPSGHSHWYRGHAVRGCHASTVVLLVGACAALVAGCGGGTRQDANEPHATFTVAVVHADFPAVQAVARPATMTLRVRNTSAGTIPNIAITVDSFDYVSNYPELAANKRPIWAIETGPGTVPRRPVQSAAVAPPGSGETAYVNTWALGPLAPGRAKTFAWHVTPVKPGVYTVHYAVSAGLSGNARARLADGAIPHGHFTVAIAPRPPATHVNPNTGQVEPGPYVPGAYVSTG
jgi:hypothetical protein